MADPSNLFYPVGPGSNSVQQFGPNPGLLSYLIASGAPQASQGQGALGAPAVPQMMAPQAQAPSFSPWQQQGTAQHPWFPQIPPQSGVLQPGQRGYWASTQPQTNPWGGVGVLGANMGGQQGGDTPGMGTPGVGRGIAAPGMTFGNALMNGAFPIGALIGALTQGNVPQPNVLGALHFLGSRMFGGGGMGAPQGGLGANGPMGGNGGQANNAGY